MMAGMVTTVRFTTVVALALVAAPLAAQEPGSRQTREFVVASGQSDSFEILEATSALAQSSSPQVRAFAQQMIDDHTRLRQAMTDAATRAGLAPPPTGPSSDQSSLLAALQSARGPDFDRLYLRHQALVHRAALAVTQRYAASGDQPEVMAAAQSALPTITSHLAMAEQMSAAADPR